MLISLFIFNLFSSDNTPKGYCLPNSNSMSDEPTTERLLNSTSFNVVRFFLHACLYFSCEENENVNRKIEI